MPRWKQYELILKHMSKASPVTELELYTIRQTRCGNWGINDKSAKHLIDRETYTVFVVSNDLAVITCYEAKYLQNIKNFDQSDEENEKNIILSVFKRKYNGVAPYFSWAMPLVKLKEMGYNILRLNCEIEFQIEDRLVKARKLGTNNKWKCPEKRMSAYSWTKDNGKVWKFDDFPTIE